MYNKKERRKKKMKASQIGSYTKSIEKRGIKSMVTASKFMRSLYNESHIVVVRS